MDTEHVIIVRVLDDEGNHFESIDEAATERTTEIFDSILASLTSGDLSQAFLC